MKLFEKTLTSETKFEGRIIKVLRDTVELENGKTSAREVVCHNGGVCVAALTEQNEVLLVRQFRYPYKEVLLELPAGKLEKGEDPFEAVKREQMEETGTTGENYICARQSVPLSRLLRRRSIRIWRAVWPKRRNALKTRTSSLKWSAFRSTKPLRWC